MKVILPVYIINNEILELTKNAIFSLDGHDLIIIDNGSEMGGGYLRALAHTYIRNNTNLGYAKAVNQGLRIIQDEYLAVANNDIRVSRNWEQVAMEIFKEDEKIGSVHIRMIDYNDEMQLGKNTWITGRERWCSSSFFVIRNSALPDGLYDENYGIGGYEDYDFWHRVRHLNGWKTAYTTKACYQHNHSFTQRTLNQEERKDRDLKSLEYFKVKWGEYPDILFQAKYPEQWEKDWKSGFYEL